MTDIRTIDPASDPAWHLLMTGPGGTVFGSPPWLCALVDTYGFDIRARVLADGENGVRGGLAYATLHDFRGDRIVSLPFTDYVDPVVDDDTDWQALIAPLLAQPAPVRFRFLRSSIPQGDDRFVARGALAWHATDLTRPEEEVHDALAPGLRQNIRAARRRGVTVRFGTELEHIRVLHELHRRTRKQKYHLLAQPLAFFENLWKQFSGRAGIYVGCASHDGDIIAAALYLVWNDTMYFKIGASIAERLSVRPNELLAWESVRLAQSLGLRTYDWGVSDIDQPGLVAYKRKFATEERTVRVVERPGAAASSDDAAASGVVLGELTDLLTRDDVPDDVTQRAGEILYRYFA